MRIITHHDVINIDCSDNTTVKENALKSTRVKQNRPN